MPHDSRFGYGCCSDPAKYGDLMLGNGLMPYGSTPVRLAVPFRNWVGVVSGLLFENILAPCEPAPPPPFRKNFVLFLPSLSGFLSRFGGLWSKRGVVILLACIFSQVLFVLRLNCFLRLLESLYINFKAIMINTICVFLLLLFGSK